MLREFLEDQFQQYGVVQSIPEIDFATAESAVPVPARWFLGQPCLLRIDKARNELGYQPIAH